jgi:FkbM family methyltransferase
MRGTQFVDVQRVSKLWHILGSPAYRRALRHGVAAAVEHEAVPYAADFRTVVDVGANRGQFALVAARRFPHAALWCFEPLPEPRAKLKAVIGQRPHTNISSTALSASAGTQEMHVTRRDDSSSLLPVSSRQRSEFAGTDEVGLHRVETARLDEVINKTQITAPALLKIDVQGYELEVLKGANGLLGLFDTIIVESSFVEFYVGQPLAAEVILFLTSMGWKLRGAYGVVYGSDGMCLQADLLFECQKTGDEPSRDVSGDRTILLAEAQLP